MPNHEITPLYQYRDLKIINLEKRLQSYLKTDLSLIITDNSRSMIYARQQDHSYTIRLHHMFLDADKTVIKALAEYISGKHKRNHRALNVFIKQNEWKIKKTPTRFKPNTPTLRVQGEHFNLQKAFQSLNKRYFQNRIDCLITWGPRRKRARRKYIRLGSYSFKTSTIRINPALDKAFVPNYVIDSIVYHEMLHHHLGGQDKGGRHLSHHPAFKKAEQQFTHFRDAKLWIRNNLNRLLK